MRLNVIGLQRSRVGLQTPRKLELDTILNQNSPTLIQPNCDIGHCGESLYFIFRLLRLFLQIYLFFFSCLRCFIHFGLDPKCVCARFCVPSSLGDRGAGFSSSNGCERNLSIVQSRPNGLCPTSAQIRPRATRSTFTVSPCLFLFYFFVLSLPFLCFYLTAVHKR